MRYNTHFIKLIFNLSKSLIDAVEEDFKVLVGSATRISEVGVGGGNRAGSLHVTRSDVSIRTHVLGTCDVIIVVSENEKFLLLKTLQ